MTKDTPVPDDICELCPTRIGWSGAKRIAYILIPAVFTAVLAAGGAAGAALVRDAQLAADVTTLRERRLEAVEERQRLAGDIVQLRSDSAQATLLQAERWGQIQASLARIELRLAAAEGRRR